MALPGREAALQALQARARLAAQLSSLNKKEGESEKKTLASGGARSAGLASSAGARPTASRPGNLPSRPAGESGRTLSSSASPLLAPSSSAAPPCQIGDGSGAAAPGPKRPPPRRPPPRRPPGPAGADASKRARAEDGPPRAGEPDEGAGHLDASGEGTGPAGDPGQCTLFVGDMPEYWSTQDLEGYFSSFATVVSCRALGDKGFGFVEFGSNGEAAEILARGAAMAFALDEGGCLRLNWARRGGADGARREEGGSVAGVAQPRPEELQRSAQEIAMAMDPALVQAATAMPRPQRNLVCYDDLL